MKPTIYSVKTGSSVNRMNLHSLTQEVFITENFEEANKVYEDEIKVLSENYISEDDIDYSPTDYENSHAIFCEITKTVDDEDVCVKTSGHYYYKTDRIK